MATEYLSELRTSPTGENEAGVGTMAWLTPNNIGVNDGVNYAKAPIAITSTISNYLKATTFGFVLTGAEQIKGISFNVDRKLQTGNSISDATVRLLISGTMNGSEKATAIAWSTSEGDVSYGGATDLWGSTITPAQARSGGFGIAIAVVSSAGVDTANVDNIYSTIYYIKSKPPSSTPMMGIF